MVHMNPMRHRRWYFQTPLSISVSRHRLATCLTRPEAECEQTRERERGGGEPVSRREGACEKKLRRRPELALPAL